MLFVSWQLFVYRLLFCVKETGLYLLTAAFIFFSVLQVYAALIHFIQKSSKVNEGRKIYSSEYLAEKFIFSVNYCT